PVGAERERHQQRLLGLRRAHRHRHDLAAVLVSKPGSVRDGVGVEPAQLERYALAHELLRLLVEPDRVAARNLLHEADDLHLVETIDPCWGCSTTSTGTCRRSRRCWQTPSVPGLTGGSSAAPTARLAHGRSRPSPA